MDNLNIAMRTVIIMIPVYLSDADKWNTIQFQVARFLNFIQNTVQVKL
jgi:hypothetical protein